MDAANDTTCSALPAVRHVLTVALDGWTDSRHFTPDPDHDAHEQGVALAAAWWPGTVGKPAVVTVRQVVAMRRAPVTCFRR